MDEDATAVRSTRVARRPERTSGVTTMIATVRREDVV